MSDPDAALAIQKKHVPELDLSTIKENMAMGLDLMKTAAYRKNGIGSIDDKRMCGSVDLMNNYMTMPKKVECKDVYSQDFYTKIEMPK